MNIAQELKQKIANLVKEEYGLTEVDFVIEHPQNAQFGDYATNVAMLVSKLVKQNPMDIASRIVYRLQSDMKVEAAGDSSLNMNTDITVAKPGFINFTISPIWLLNILSKMLVTDNNYGVDLVPVQKRIALEHSNVNPNKAIHIGHLRNACIGQFVERVYEHQGHAVEVQYYANNVGVQVATSMMGIQKITDVSPTSYKKYDHYAWDVYAKMESLIEQTEGLQKERLDILTKLDDPSSEESIMQREVANKILLEQLKSFSELGFDYDVIIYEADILAKKLWEKAFEKLKENPKVYYADSGASKGCWLVKLAENPKAMADVETDKIIVRSNGVPTYTGKDIAYHMWKYGLLGIDFGYKKWDSGTQRKDLWVTTSEDNAKQDITFSNADEVFDVVGVEQTYAIDVVKQALAFLGYEKESQSMKHINYGFVFLSRPTAEKLGIDVSDGKKFYAMSGRKGWGIKVDDLITMIDSQLTADYGHFTEVAKVRNAAIKFQMLKINTFQDLIFDLDEALDLKGYSGPYLQYAFVRANAVLAKAVERSKDYSYDAIPQDLDPKELDLIKFLIRFPGIIDQSAKTFAPNIMCEYLFELSKRFNSFYNDLSILNAATQEQKEFRLYLCSAFSRIIQKGLWLLGIDTPEKM